MIDVFRGIFGLLADAVDVAIPRMPAHLSGTGGPARIKNEIPRPRKIAAILFLVSLALLPLVVMGLIYR